MPEPAPLQESVTLVATPVAPMAGLGLLGAGGGDPALVVNDQTGPSVEPLLLVATTCQ